MIKCVTVLVLWPSDIRKLSVSIIEQETTRVKVRTARFLKQS